MSSLLELRNVTVRFGGNEAVSDASLAAEGGTITGLIGPNGAGKTTTFNVITGLQRPSSGQVLWSGDDISASGAHRRAQRGLARTFQRFELFGSLTVAENVLLGGELLRRHGGSERHTWAPGVKVSDSAVEEAASLLDYVGLGDVADVRAEELPTGTARLVELARALASRPLLLMLDEPASGLDENETEQFSQTLRDLADAGLGILLVEHDVPMVMKLVSKLYVLDIGRVLASGTPAEIQRNQQVIDAYLGSAEVGAT